MISVSATSAYEQRARIAREADARQDGVMAAVAAEGFEIDWKFVLFDVADLDNDMDVIDFGLRRQFSKPSFRYRDTVTALAINGAGLAAWTQHEHERLAGLTAPILPIQIITEFREPQLQTPTKAIEFWRKLLGLTDDQADKLASIDTRSSGAAIADRVATALIERIQKLHDETVTKGTSLADFIKEVRSFAPEQSRSLLETEYRTHLSQVYGGALHEQITSRANAFPFTQFFAIIDGRTTDLICRPMGTSGPGGRGYIAATTDPTWIRWKTPAHWKCRSMHSPISYLEAKRIGILAADGVTKIALVGNNPDRPYGDPPKFATGPDGELRAVQPQEGFGG